jgi:hypothetical protein
VRSAGRRRAKAVVVAQTVPTRVGTAERQSAKVGVVPNRVGSVIPPRLWNKVLWKKAKREKRRKAFYIPSTSTITYMTRCILIYLSTPNSSPLLDGESAMVMACFCNIYLSWSALNYDCISNAVYFLSLSFTFFVTFFVSHRISYLVTQTPFRFKTPSELVTYRCCIICLLIGSVLHFESQNGHLQNFRDGLGGLNKCKEV